MKEQPASAVAETVAQVSSTLVDQIPTLGETPPRKIALLVEPTPFTHVSGYTNRFKEMLCFLSKAGDDVEILTVDCHTPEEKLPKVAFGYEIQYTKGIVFPLYKQFSMTLDLPEMKGAKMLMSRRPDILHVVCP